MCLLLAWAGHARADGGWLLRDWRAFGLLVLFYPVVEEIAFRGWIQGYLMHGVLADRHWRVLSLPNLITTLLFAAMHLVYHTPYWALLVIAPSLVYGYFRERSGSVMPSIALHAFYNFVYFSLIKL